MLVRPAPGSASARPRPPGSRGRQPPGANRLRAVGPPRRSRRALRGASRLREQSPRTTLDEEDQRHQDENLSEHRAGVRFQQLVDDPEGHPADERAPQVADAAEDYDHERVDDVRLAQIRTDVRELAERYTGDTRDSGTEPE